jgi:hypothetical protein
MLQGALCRVPGPVLHHMQHMGVYTCWRWDVVNGSELNLC